MITNIDSPNKRPARKHISMQTSSATRYNRAKIVLHTKISPLTAIVALGLSSPLALATAP